MTSAHIFYIPVILLIGIMAGYFIGQYSTEQKLKERRKKLKRRRKLRDKKARETQEK